MANTNSIVVAAIDSEYFAIIFAKRDRCCRGRRSGMKAMTAPRRKLPRQKYIFPFSKHKEV